jgi:4-amino-4-deoxy-L-arabinose transferase-like glycosyltransferase
VTTTARESAADGLNVGPRTDGTVTLGLAPPTDAAQVHAAVAAAVLHEEVTVGLPVSARSLYEEVTVGLPVSAPSLYEEVTVGLPVSAPSLYEEVTVGLPVSAPSLAAAPRAVTTVETRTFAPFDETAELPRPADLSRSRRHPGSGLYGDRATGGRPRQRRLSWTAAPPLVVTAAVVALLAWNMTGFPSASDDEGTYLAQAWAVQHGLGLAHYTYWYDHPPLAWIQLAAVSWLPATLDPSGLSVGIGRLSMLPVAAACLLLLYVLGRRLGLSRWASCVAICLYGLSPISVTMMRQIYLDSFAVMWILVAFVFALSPRRHLWLYAAAGATAALAVLSKETMLVAVPGVVVAIWQGTRRTPLRPWSIAGFSAGLIVVGSFYPLYAILKGELLPGPGHVSLVGAWMFQLGRPGSGSMLVPGTNSNQLLHSWLYYDPILILAGAVAALAGLAVRRLRSVAVALVLLIAVALRPGGYLPAMYIVQLFPLFALALAGLADLGAGLLLRKGRGWVWLRSATAVLIALGVVVYVAPRWYVGDERAVTVQANSAYDQAAQYLRVSVADKAHTTIVTDDVLWLDLVRAGYSRDRTLWFYKVDLDPAVSATLPHGWRDVDVIVSTPAIRQDPNDLPTVKALLLHSTAIATFGSGDGRIEIRRVNKEEP